MSNPRFTISLNRETIRQIALSTMIAGLAAAGPVANLRAGSFAASDLIEDPNAVFHMHGYTGASGNITVTVCIDPASENKAAMVTSIENVIRTFNNLVPTVGNLKLGAENNIPSNAFDFESAALHEVGHCIGLGHTNNSTESGLGCNTSGLNCANCNDCERDFTKSIPGPNTVFDLNSGADSVIATSDDLRSDDINLNWFRKSNNNPFTIASVVDSTTYSVDIADRPSGNYSASASRCVSNVLRSACDTEAVMKQGAFNDEDQRTLGHDDVAMLRYARSGLDELAGTGDDYTWTLEFIGEATDCDVKLSMRDDVPGFAACIVSAQNIGATGHFRMTPSVAEFNSTLNWFFNDVSNSDCSVDENLVLDGNVVNDTQVFQACNTITATNFTVGATGDVTFRAGQRVTLGEGFNIDPGGLIDVQIDPTIN